MAIENIRLKPENVRNFSIAQAAHWLGNNIAADKIVMAEQKEIVHQISKRKVISFPVLTSGEKIVQTMKNTRTEYLVIINEGKYPYFYPTEEQRFEMISRVEGSTATLLKSDTDYKIYKIDYR